jgi:hypothetical protein
VKPSKSQKDTSGRKSGRRPTFNTGNETPNPPLATNPTTTNPTTTNPTTTNPTTANPVVHEPTPDKVSKAVGTHGWMAGWLDGFGWFWMVFVFFCFVCCF